MLKQRGSDAEPAAGSSAETSSPSPHSLAEVLIGEHRQWMRTLRRLEDEAGRGPVDEAIFESSVLCIAAQLASETVLTGPVVRHVLERTDHFGLYRVEVQLIMRSLERAGSEQGETRAFVSAVGQARLGYSNLVYRGELEVLTFMHHEYPPLEQGRLAASYAKMQDQILSRYRRDRAGSEPAWSDRELVPSLQAYFEEELANEAPEQAGRRSRGWQRSSGAGARRGAQARRTRRS